MFKDASLSIRLPIRSSNGQRREQCKGIISDGVVMVMLGQKQPRTSSFSDFPRLIRLKPVLAPVQMHPQ